MDLDSLLRISVLVGAGMVLLGGAVGGLLTPVGGRWRDGEHIVRLTQFGPLVRGEASVPGGRQIYSGWALFGRVWLSRRDSGAEHLLSLGFESEAVPVVNGTITARLRFELQRGQRLFGEFIGLRFDFSEPPVRILRTTRIAAGEREWVRA